MLLKQAILGTVELASQQILSLSSNAEALTDPLDGSLCIIHIQELEITLGLHFSEQSISITDSEGLNEDELSNLGDNECFVSISLSALPELQKTSHLTKLIKQGKLDFYGDLRVLQKVSKLFSDLDIDLAEILSQYIGDVPTHYLTSTFLKAKADLSTVISLQATSIADLMFDERPIAVRAIMIANFVDEVRQLDADVSRLEARIALLEKSSL